MVDALVLGGEADTTVARRELDVLGVGEGVGGAEEARLRGRERGFEALDGFEEQDELGGGETFDVLWVGLVILFRY